MPRLTYQTYHKRNSSNYFHVSSRCFQTEDAARNEQYRDCTKVAIGLMLSSKAKIRMTSFASDLTHESTAWLTATGLLEPVTRKFASFSLDQFQLLRSIGGIATRNLGG